MIYHLPKDYNELEPGQIVYACAYSFNNNKETKALMQKPIKGMIVAGSSEKMNNSLMQTGTAYARYFVPFNKHGKPSWSKTVQYRHRYYADSEEECIDLYNSLVRNAIQWHENEIKKIHEDFIPTIEVI